MSAGDWIAVAAITVPTSGSLIMMTVKVTALLTRLSDRVENHEGRIQSLEQQQPLPR